jgi:hypothetical protein
MTANRKRNSSLLQFVRPEGAWREAKLPGLNGNSPEAKSFNRYVREMIADAGGQDQMTALSRGLRYRAAALMVILDQLDGRMLSGVPIDIAVYVLLTGTLTRIARLVGIEPRKREPESLDAYLSRLQNQRGSEGDGGEAAVDLDGSEAAGDGVEGEGGARPVVD